MIIQSQFLMGQSLTDYNYKKALTKRLPNFR